MCFLLSIKLISLTPFSGCLAYEIKEAVETAKENLKYNKKTVLFIDEIHRYSKTQQDALLPHLEKGTFYLVGSTTENPSFSVVPALLSRVQVIMLDALDDGDIKSIVNKGFNYLIDNYNNSAWLYYLIFMIVNIIILFFFKGFKSSYFPIKDIKKKYFIRIITFIYCILASIIIIIFNSILQRNFFYFETPALIFIIVTTIAALILSFQGFTSIISLSTIFFTISVLSNSPPIALVL